MGMVVPSSYDCCKAVRTVSLPWYESDESLNNSYEPFRFMVMLPESNFLAYRGNTYRSQACKPLMAVSLGA